MKKKIFRVTFISIIGVVVLTIALVMNGLYHYFNDIQKQQLKIETDLIAAGINQSGLDYLNDVESHDYRITWIDSQGGVLYDNYADVSAMENHLNREEVRQAYQSGYGSSSRFSDTLMQTYLYGAKLLEDGTVIRLSIAQNSIVQLTFGMSGIVLIIFFVAMLLSSFLAKRIGAKIVGPINSIDLDHPYENVGYDEIAPLLTRITKQQNELDTKRLQIEKQAYQNDLMVNSMQEGLIVLSQHSMIQQINPAACLIFNTTEDCLHRDFITICRNLDINNLIDEGINGKRSEKVVYLNEKAYQFIVSPIRTHESFEGILLLMIDYSEEDKLNKLRREFTANVSHELKTPLQSISGRAELLANGLVKQEDIADFGTVIYQQAQNMNVMIENIIELSKLEECQESFIPSEVDLGLLVNQVMDNLRDLATKQRIELIQRITGVRLVTVEHLMTQILTNLIENAIKYNKENGQVVVDCQEEEDVLELTISDTGIGIEPQEQEKIFERFYRIDKSRSRQTGGTGLGLSIVKHAASLINATISIESKVNYGTKVHLRIKKGIIPSHSATE